MSGGGPFGGAGHFGAPSDTAAAAEALAALGAFGGGYAAGGRPFGGHPGGYPGGGYPEGGLLAHQAHMASLRGAYPPPPRRHVDPPPSRKRAKSTADARGVKRDLDGVGSDPPLRRRPRGPTPRGMKWDGVHGWGSLAP